MITVHKFVFSDVRMTVRLPHGAQVRSVGLDPRTQRPAIWVELDTGANKTERVFVAYGTGDAIMWGSHFVGTVFQGRLVWHVYEERQ